MKIRIISVILFALFISSSFKWPNILLRMKLPGWVIEEQQDKIVLTKNDSITINCCVLNPLYYDDGYDQKYKFSITIEKSSRLSQKEIRKRIADQKVISDSLKINEGNRIFHGTYHGFRIKRNSIDSLRLPLMSTGKNSFFLVDKVETLGYLNGYFKYENELLEIIEVRKKIYSVLKLKYQDPNWVSEYGGPVEYNHKFQRE